MKLILVNLRRVTLLIAIESNQCEKSSFTVYYDSTKSGRIEAVGSWLLNTDTIKNPWWADPRYLFFLNFSSYQRLSISLIPIELITPFNLLWASEKHWTRQTGQTADNRQTIHHHSEMYGYWSYITHELLMNTRSCN